MTAIAFNREHQAVFWARAHMESDFAIAEVWHLPYGADPKEIRLVEVNSGQVSFSDDGIEPVSFGIDRGEPTQHLLAVLDLTEDQWKRMKAGNLAPPAGWSVKNCTLLKRRE